MLCESEERLRHAKKMRAIGQPAGGFANDFNNVLQAVTSNLELIRRRVRDEAGKADNLYPIPLVRTHPVMRF